MKVIVSSLSALVVLAGVAAPAGAATVKRLLPKPSSASGYSNGGDFGTPVWSHPLVERVVKQLGWRNLRMSEDQTADRARFVQAYEQLLARATTEEMLLPEVRGYIEARGGLLLAPSDQMRLLSDKLNMRKS